MFLGRLELQRLSLVVVFNEAHHLTRVDVSVPPFSCPRYHPSILLHPEGSTVTVTPSPFET